MPDVFSDPGFLVPFSLVQVLALLAVMRFFDRYERGPIGIVVAMALWGATVAPAIAISLREPLLEAFGDGTLTREAMSAALVEEPAKGIALMAAFALSWLAARRFGLLEFEGVTDGAVYGAAIGLGFAFTENLFYLVQADSIASGLTVFVDRSDFGGLAMLGHAVYTGTFGAFLGLATWQRGWVERIACGIAGLGLAVIAHAAHNGLLAGGNVNGARLADYISVVAFFGGLLYWVSHQRKVLDTELKQEIEWGLLDDPLRHEVLSPWQSLVNDVQLVRESGVDQLRVERELRRELIELGFARWKLRTVGLRGASEPTELRRRRIAELQTYLGVTRAHARRP